MTRLLALVGRLAPLAILVSAPTVAGTWAATAAAQVEAPPEDSPGDTPDGSPGDAPEESPGDAPGESTDESPGDTPADGPDTLPAETGEETGEGPEVAPETDEQADELTDPAPEDTADPAGDTAEPPAAVPPTPPAEPVDEPGSGASPASAELTAEDTPADAAAAEEATVEEPPAPWRGSVLELRNAFGIIGLDPSAELTHNPYYSMAFSMRPRWWFGDVLNVGARLDIGGELTDADDTTYANETVVQDLLLNVGASKLYTIPVADIRVSTSLRVTLPTSKVSRARTLVLGLGPAVALAREFPLDSAGSLSVGYNARFSMLLHQNTTSEYETPFIPGCSPASGGCESFLNTGYRNTQFRLANGVDVSYDPMDWMGVSISYLHIVDWLYPIEANDPRVSYEASPNTDVRYRSAFGLEAYFTPTPMLEVGVGYETVSPQQQADSSYYNPLYNRYSTGYVDLRLQVEALVDQIVEITRGQDR